MRMIKIIEEALHEAHGELLELIPRTTVLKKRRNFGIVEIISETERPITEEEELIFKRNKFTDLAFIYVDKALTSKGYKFIGYNNDLLKEITVYDLYADKDFEKLVWYYSASFAEEGDKRIPNWSWK